MDLSVVLPTLHRVGTSQLLARRIGELCGAALRYEVIIVTPVADPSGCAANVRFVPDDGRGVYAAYARGLREARGEYVWFMGDDDFPLDSFSAVVDLIKEARFDLIVAPVIYSTGRLYKPTSSRFVLLFYNWCQQGVLYRTRVLAPHRFYGRLKVQADHYVNILLRSDSSLQVEFAHAPICIFGAHGVSSRGGDRRFRALRPYLAHRTLGPAGFLAFTAVVALADGLKRLKRLVR